RSARPPSSTPFPYTTLFRSEDTGYLALGTTVSAAIGPALALFVLGAFDYQMLFVIVLGISIVSLIASLIMFVRTSDAEPDVDESGEPAAPVKFSFKSIINPKVLPI